MNEMKFKLYHYPASRSARVKWMLHEVLEDDFEVEIVPLYEGGQYDQDYLLKNPNHCVPTLEISRKDGKIMHMFESAAMVAWLADAFAEKELAPPAGDLSFKRADYLQMLHFGASWMDMMLWQIRTHEHILPEPERDQKTIDRYRNKFIKEVEPQLKSRLLETKYICGNDFSAADCIIGHNIMWARGYGMCRDDIYKRYLSIVSKRPAFASAFSDAHLFSAEVPQGKAITSKFTG